MSRYEPVFSRGDCAVPIGDKVYLCGRYDLKSKKVYVFDISKEKWGSLKTHGSPPPGGQNFAYTVIGSSLYTFGGDDGSHSRFNNLHQLDTKTMEWRELVPKNPLDAPQKKHCCGMVALDDEKLVVFAGFTEHYKRTNELHVFDTKKLMWSSPPTTGPKPPPLSAFTFTKIDADRAVVFGGGDGKGGYHNDVYILDMRNWQWTLLDVSAGLKPPSRQNHAACCLAGPLTGQEHPLLVVVGGQGDGTVLEDIWFLDIDEGRWKEVHLSETIQPRSGHTAIMFGTGPGYRHMVLGGGLNVSSDRPQFSFLDFELNRREWEVTCVLNSDQLGKPVERLTEKMERLRPTPTQVYTRAAEKIASLEDRLSRAEEEAEQAKELKEKLKRAEEQAKELKEKLKRAEEELKEKLKTTEAPSDGQQLRNDEELVKKYFPPNSIPQRGDKPKFRHLKLGFEGKDGISVRVIETVAAKWSDVAFALDFKRHVVNTIRQDNSLDSESACEEVLDRWLSGDLTTRQPVTWETLIQSLRDCHQSSLAEDLDRALL